MVIAIAASLLLGLLVGLYFGNKMGVANALTHAVKAAVQEKKEADDNQQEPPAYIVVMGKSYDPGNMKPYVKALPELYKKYQGAYVAMATDVDVLEGEFNYMSILISKWPSVAHAQKFWNSNDYQEVKKLRQGVGDFNVFLVKGLPASFSTQSTG